MNERQRRIARARLLRRNGKTYDEIRAALDVDVSDDTLQAWMKGIPRPPASLRGRAKDELRRECQKLRAAGFTYSEIATKTGASKGSISPWVRDIPMSSDSRRRHHERSSTARKRAGDTNRRRANARRAQIWLDLLGVSEERRCYRLNIHESADVRAQEQWWAEALRIPLTSFARATLKWHNPKTVRHSSGAGYHGCLVVSVRTSGALYYAIEGWWRALSEGQLGGIDGAHWSRNWSPVG